MAKLNKYALADSTLPQTHPRLRRLWQSLDGMALARSRPLLVGEKYGFWGKAVEVPGSAALNTGETAQLNSVSCASTGKCAAGGFCLALNRLASARVARRTQK